MKRGVEKGQDKFEWMRRDEAMDTITANLKK
jgi:hypothetical protein